MELPECLHLTQPHEVVICGLDLIYFLFLLISKLRSWIVKFFQEIHLGILFGVLSVSHSYRSMDHIYQAGLTWIWAYTKSN